MSSLIPSTEKTAAALYRYRRVILVLSIFVWIASAAIVTRLQIRSSFTELLPKSFQSVKDLNAVVDRVGGNDRLIIVVEGQTFEQNRAMVEAIMKEVHPLLGKEFGTAFYNAKNAVDFFQNKFLYYYSVDQLISFHERLQSEITKFKQKLNPFYIDLEDEPKKSEEVLGKQKEEYSPFHWQTREGYVGRADGSLLLIILAPYTSSMNVEKARYLIGLINGALDRAKAQMPEFVGEVGLAGQLMGMVEEHEVLIQDIYSTAFICFMLIVLALFLYFRVFRFVLFLGYILVFSATVTFAITALTVGYLNAQTAFLGSLIVGTGINYAIIFLGRFNEARRHLGPVEAITASFSRAFIPTLMACLTTVASFLTLCLSINRGLSQFGYIGSVGVLLCWIFTMIHLPAFLGSFAPTRQMEWVTLGKIGKAVFTSYGNLLRRIQPLTLPIIIVTVVASVPFLVHYFQDPIEYDFKKLRNERSSKSGTAARQKKIADIHAGSMTPALMLVEDINQTDELIEKVHKRVDEVEATHHHMMLGSFNYIGKFLPKEIDKKRPILKQIHALMEDRLLKVVPKEKKDDFLLVRKASDPNWHPSVEELPKVIKDKFTERNGKLGTIIFVNPRPGHHLANGHNLFTFAATVQGHTLSDGTHVPATSGSLVLADLIRIIQEDGPRLSLISFSLVFVLLLLMVHRRRDIVPILASLLIGVGGMFIYLAVADVKLNFFNFIALPLTFGIAVDYAINVYYKVKLGETQSFTESLQDSVLSVGTCSATTIIGYSSLVLGSSNKAVESFAKVALAGELTCYGAAIIFIPLFILGRSRVKKVAGAKPLEKAG